MKKMKLFMFGLGMLMIGILLGTLLQETSIVQAASITWKKLGANIYNALSGNVGIGTKNPSEKLTVAGNLKLEGSHDILGLKNINPGGKSTYFGGKVGIGTTNPTHELTVDGDLNIKGQDIIGLDSINPGGKNVGIGKSSPSTALDVSGTVTATDFECSSCVDSGEVNMTQVLGSIKHFEYLGSINGTSDIYDNTYVKIKQTEAPRIFELYCGHMGGCTYVYYYRNGSRTAGTLSYEATVSIVLIDDGDDVRFYFAKKMSGMDMLVCDVFDTNGNWVHFLCHDTYIP